MTTTRPEALIRRHAVQLALPDRICRLNEMINNPHYDTGDIVHLIEEDAELSARLLQLVNSPFYDVKGRVRSVGDAGALLGARPLRDLTVGISVVRQFRDIPPALLDLGAFWRHALASAMLAQSIATHLGVVRPERFMLIGLVHDIGQLAVCKLMPEAARSIRACRAQAPGIELAEAERAVLGCDHAALGGALLRHWGLPDSLVEAVHFHHRPEQARRFAQEAAAGYLASALADSAPERISADTAALLGIPAQRLARIQQLADGVVVQAAAEAVYGRLAA